MHNVEMASTDGVGVVEQVVGALTDDNELSSNLSRHIGSCV